MRPTGWEERLSAFIEERRHMPFEWGKNDCTSFTLKAIERVFSLNFTARFCKWTTEEEAQATIRRFGSNLQEACENVLPGFGFKEVELCFASRGDLVVYEGINGQTMSLCTGNKLAAPGPMGLVFMPHQGITCWKIGE